MMKKILVPFDGSETALRALEFAAGIGKPFGSEIMVVNVIVPYDYTKVPPRKPKNAIEEAEMAAKEPDPTPLSSVCDHGSTDNKSVCCNRGNDKRRRRRTDYAECI